MSKFYPCLVIDDDTTSNLICDFTIKRFDKDANTKTFTSPEAALEFIQDTGFDSAIEHTVIFLDVNMPTMSGFEFLLEFMKLPEVVKEKYIIYMLTSSIEDFSAQAQEFPMVKGFLSKPMKISYLEQIQMERRNFSALPEDEKEISQPSQARAEMERRSVFSAFFGFLVLFAIYHFPEFFEAFWVSAVFKIGFLVVAILVARAQKLEGLRAFGLGFNSGWLKYLVLGLLSGSGSFLIYLFAASELGFLQVLNIVPTLQIFEALPMILLFTFFPSLAEDILTRGYLLAFLKPLQNWTWIFLSAVVYVLNHIWRLDDGVGVLSYLFFLGLVLAYAVVLTRSLWLAFGIHWGANIIYELTNAAATLQPSERFDDYVLAATWAILLLFFTALFPLPKNPKSRDFSRR